MAGIDEKIAATAGAGSEPVTREGISSGMSFIFFVVGIGSGFLISLFWSDFFGGTLSTVISIFVVALIVLSGLVMLFFVFRRRILDYLFNVTQTQLANFAEPLADVTRLALKKDADGATSAARRLVQLSLARYAWVSTRRWIMASLTALIAAMAALGGTALLFKQNELLANQSVLLKGQNTRLAEQNRLIGLDINLAEAARNAELVVEISNIASELGRTVKGLQEVNLAALPAGTVPRQAFYIPLIPDPMRDIDPGLVARIVSASLATRPYKFLRTQADPRDQDERYKIALALRPDLLAKVTAAQKKDSLTPQDDTQIGQVAPAKARTDLIERPVSPERGQLLSVLLKAGIHKTEWLTFNGLDLSYAKVEINTVAVASFHQAKLAFSDFSYVEIGDSDFGGATLDNAWFRKSIIFDTRFSSVPADKIPEPFAKTGGTAPTFMSGADFSGAAVLRSRFDEANVTAVRFDNSVLSDVSFTGAVLVGSTFRNTVLIDVNFSGALLAEVKFDGAFVFDKNFLSRLEADAALNSFKPGHYTLQPVDSDEVYKNQVAFAQSGVRITKDKFEGRQAYRMMPVAKSANAE